MIDRVRCKVGKIARKRSTHGGHPPSQFRILQQLTTGEVETKRPTETTDLRERGRERFFVVRSDRDFAFTVDGLSLVWPLATIVGEHMRILARAKESEDLVRVTPHGFEPVEAEDILSLAGSEVEEFRLVPLPQTVTVFYREQPFELERRRWTTEELMQRFAVPAGYKPDRIKADGEFKELKPGQQIKLRDGLGTPLVFLPGLRVESSGTVHTVDALLSPASREGYEARLISRGSSPRPSTGRPMP